MEKVRIGMIGCGGMARAHMRNLFDLPEAEIVGLADPSNEQIDACRRSFPKLADVPVFSDYKELLAAVEMDAVEISTPHTQHTDQILTSLQMNLHVMCEKPLVTNTPDARRVLDALEKSGKIGVLAYQRHNMPIYQFIRNKIRSGEMGQVMHITGLLCQQWKTLTAGSWRQVPELSGGGQLNDSGSHLIDIILWVTGLEPEVVSAFADFRGTPVDIDSTLSIRFKGGALASLAVMGDFPTWNEDLTIDCENGAFIIRHGKLTYLQQDGSKFAVDYLPGGGNPDANFVGAILGREEVLAPFACGLPVIQLTEAAWKSAEREGMPVKVAELG